jgi:hypothetical protein
VGRPGSFYWRELLEAWPKAKVVLVGKPAALHTEG